MAHKRIDVDLPLAKVYEYLSDPTYFPHFLERINKVNKVNSQTFEYQTKLSGENYQWTTNIIDDLRNTRFAWITINGNLNQTGTIRFTPLDNGERTRVDFSLDYRTFYGEPEEELAEFIEALPAQMQKDLDRFKEEAESKKYKEKADDTLAEIEEKEKEAEEAEAEVEEEEAAA